MAVNWLLGAQQGPSPGEQFNAALLGGQQRRQQQEELNRQREVRDSGVRAGKHVAAGDYTGATQQAAQSGNIDLMRTIQGLSQEQRQQVAARNAAVAPLRLQARQLPYEQRRALIQAARPNLLQRGFTEAEIDSYDPTDQRLDADIADTMTLEQALTQGSIDWRIIPQVGAFAVDSRGFPVNPGQMQRPGMPAQGPAPQIPTAQPPVQAPAQAAPIAASGYASGVATTLAQAGVPAPVIAGILGNGHHESGGRWNAAVGDGGTAHGAMQWRNERVRNFQQVTGVHPGQASPQQTAQFILWELQNPERAGMTRAQAQAILTAQTPEQAAILFSQHYERPNARLAHNDRRAALAAQYAGQGVQTAQGAAPAIPGQQRTLQDQAATGVIQAPRQAPQGYEWTPEGQLRAVPGGPGDQTYPRARDAQTDARDARRDAAQMVNQFNSDPEVRQFRQARIATTQIRSLGQSGNPADDVGLIFSFMRALDPNSTVREGEFATAQNTAGIPDRIRNWYNQAQRGTLLGPQQRQEMIGTAYRLYVERARSYNEIAETNRQQAVAMGISAAQAARMFPLANAPRTEDARRQQGARPQGRTSQGVRWRVVG